MKLFGLEFSLPKRRERAPDPPGVSIPHYIPEQLKALSWLATAGVFYMLWLFSLGAAKDAAGALHITHAATWTGNVLFYFPVIVAFIMISMVVAWTGKVAVPAFVSLRWAGDELWPKGWMLLIMVAVSSVIIAGSITVQTETRFEGNREQAVAGEQVQRGRAGIEAQKQSAQEELNQALSNQNAYLNQAANVGAAEWQRSYVTQARATNDPRLPQIERALGAARRADELRAQIRTLTVQIAEAPTDASVTRRVVSSEADATMGGFVDWLSAIRAIMLAVIQDIACLLLPWIAMRTEQARSRQMAAAGSAADFDEAHMIEDHSADAPIDAQPMERQQEAVFDAETGERLVKVKAREHWRRVPKGKKQKVDIANVPTGDETGVFDASRTGYSAEDSRTENGDKAKETEKDHGDLAAVVDTVDDHIIHTPEPTTPAYSAEDLDAVYALTEANEIALPGNEGVMINESEDQDSHVREWEKAAQQGARQLEAAE
jgi:hypothetical protein